MHKDGSLVDVAITAFPLLDAAGQQTGAAAIMRDIRASVVKRASSPRGEQRYREILEHTPTGHTLDVESRVDYVNERMAEILGYSPEEILVAYRRADRPRGASDQRAEHRARPHPNGRQGGRTTPSVQGPPTVLGAHLDHGAVGQRGQLRGALAIISDVTGG